MITLRNSYLSARFCDTTGLLTSLVSSAAPDQSLIKHSYLRYHNDKSGTFPSQDKTQPSGQWQILSLTHDSRQVTAMLQNDLFTITQLMTLEPDSPVLDIRLKVQGRLSQSKEDVRVLTTLGLLGFELAEDFINHFEDEEDLYDDGAQLSTEESLRPWRVFFREGRQTGLLLTTRTLHDMACASIGARQIGICPQSPLNYVTSQPERLGARESSQFESGIQIGPWQAAHHEALLQACRLHEPVRVPATATGNPPTNLQGHVISLVDHVPVNAVSQEFRRDRWRIVDVPWSLKGKVLMANVRVQAPDIEVAIPFPGPVHVYVGIGNGRGICMKVQDEPYPRFRHTPPAAWPKGHEDTTPFHPQLSGHHAAVEVDMGVIDPRTSASIRLGIFPGEQDISILDYVRFVPLSEYEAAAEQKMRNTPAAIELSGFVDIPDIAILTNPRDPDPDVYRANIWEHARQNVRKIYWRIDGQCSDYPSRHNTMRYPMARVHGVFSPRSKAYGRVLRKVDMLKLAVDAAREYGVELWGWMRFNSYVGNVVSDFYRNNSQWWEVSPRGSTGRQLCIAIPEVRKHKIDILVEVAGYGLTGLNLGFLRHTPVLGYHPVLVDTFKARYGYLPPRDEPQDDQNYIRHLPPTDELHQRWYQHRADYLTTFGRELREALKQASLEHLPVSIWVRPNHCLFDGIDLPRWLNEGLCQEVVVNGVVGPDMRDEQVYGVRPEWKQMVQAKARIIRGINLYFDHQVTASQIPKVLEDGYDGLCTYESNMAVLDSRCINVYESLRKV
jgi:hypothetical protein